MTSPLPWHILFVLFTFDFCAEYIGNSSKHFYYNIWIIYSSHGMDFTEYLNNYRLIMAAKLLKSSDESILMLAGSVVLTACLILIVFLKENMVFHPEFTEKYRSCRESLVND